MIYFPDFCELILKWFREDESQEETFRQNMFKVNSDYIGLKRGYTLIT